MTPMKHIRKHIFGMNQDEFGRIAGTTQASVSRWERGEQSPDQQEMARIRDAARERGLDWNDVLFFETPSPAEVAS